MRSSNAWCGYTHPFCNLMDKEARKHYLRAIATHTSRILHFVYLLDVRTNGITIVDMSCSKRGLRRYGPTGFPARFSSD